MNLKTIHNIYFIGIGGIGMSALARYFHENGKIVSGYDLNRSATTKMLESLGIAVYYEAQPERMAQQDLIVYTPAVPPNHPEFQEANALGVAVMKRALVLGLISESYHTLAIAGTHGKTTTASMLAHILNQGNSKTTAFLGGITKNYQSNYLTGDSQYAVIEADEYDKSFLQLHPFMTVITAMDPDHLECYGTHASMKQAFMDFADQTHSQQPLLVNDSLSSVPWKRAILTYGINHGDFQATHIQHNQLKTTFDFVGDHFRIDHVNLKLPGIHNISNMVAAMSMAYFTGLPAELIKLGAETFEGIYRRFDVQFHQQYLTYIDDYAHHPVEVDATMKSVKAIFPTRQLIVVFQPHLFSRTQEHFQGFAEALSPADHVLLMDIYPARETPIPGVTSELIFKEITHKNKSIVSRDELISSLDDKVEQPSVILTLGAGNIDQVVSDINSWLQKKYKTN